jgi:DNA-binding CsgD family transcriptional regulator
VYSEDTLLRLIQQIYDAALAPERWSAFLEAFAEAVDGVNVNLAYSGPTGKDASAVVTARFDPHALAEYNQYFHRCDPWAERAFQRGLFHSGALALGTSLITTTEYHLTPFYNEFGRRYGFTTGLSAVIRADNGGTAALNAIQRTNTDFGEAELTLVRGLMPHLQQAFQIHDRLEGIVQQRRAAEDVIDRLPFGVVLVDAAARACLVNQVAQLILAGRDGLLLRQKSLVATKPAETNEIRELIARAIDASSTKGLGSGAALSVTRPSSKRPLQLLVVPIRSRAANLTVGSSAPAAAIFLSDPERESVAPEEILRQFYGLTPAESRLATELLRHHSVTEAAEILRISRNTARTQLKRLFEKTNTRRQSELLQLLGSGVAQLRMS